MLQICAWLVLVLDRLVLGKLALAGVTVALSLLS
jgi:hypothetical protein